MVILNGFNTPTDYIDFGPNINKFQGHIVCSYGYKLICVDEQ